MLTVLWQTKTKVSFPLVDKHVANEQHTIQKSHNATKKCPYRVHFNVPRDWFEKNLRHQKHYSEGGKKICGCGGLLRRVIWCPQEHKKQNWKWIFSCFRWRNSMKFDRLVIYILLLIRWSSFFREIYCTSFSTAVKDINLQNWKKWWKMMKNQTPPDFINCENF